MFYRSSGPSPRADLRLARLVAFGAIAVGACHHDASAVTEDRDGGATGLSPGRPSARAPAGEARPATLHGLSASVDRSCADICERSRQLKCQRAGECEDNCRAMAMLTPCNETIGAFYRCLVRQPIANWECDDDGLAEIREGICDKEQADVASCAEEKMAR